MIKFGVDLSSLSLAEKLALIAALGEVIEARAPAQGSVGSQPLGEQYRERQRPGYARLQLGGGRLHLLKTKQSAADPLRPPEHPEPRILLRAANQEGKSSALRAP